MSNEYTRNKRVEKAQLRVLFQVPFFAPGVAKLPVQWDDKVETACTDGERILWNPDWFDSLEDQEIVTVYCHEVAHCMLGHIWRVPAGAPMEKWNIACDHAVNLMLEDWSKEVTGQRLADPFPFPKCGCVKDPQYRGMSEEVIFSKLPPEPPGGGGRGGKPGKGNGANFGRFVNGANGTQDPAAAKHLQCSWDNTLQQSLDAAKALGSLPLGLERQIQKHFDPGVPWYELLRNWVREQAADDWNWMKGNQLYSDADFMLPVLESERVGPLVFAKDTSGSITPEILEHFVSEEQEALDDLKPSRLVDLCCDAAVQSVEEYHVGDQISTQAKGGGGTDFRPVFEHIATKLGEAPKCLVYLTDLYGTFPKDAPEYPVLWVSWSKETQAPFGTVINVET